MSVDGQSSPFKIKSSKHQGLLAVKNSRDQELTKISVREQKASESTDSFRHTSQHQMAMANSSKGQQLAELTDGIQHKPALTSSQHYQPLASGFTGVSC